jgi:hypothetical protein
VRGILMTTTCLGLFAAVGCENVPPPVHDERRPFNLWVVQSLDDESIANAVITQHTLYPYHFARGGTALNDLGKRDVRILARHFNEYAGELNMRRGRENDASYVARIAAVQAELGKHGVTADRVRVVDGMPGGDGVASDRAIEITSRSSAPFVGNEEGVSTVGSMNAGGRP